MSSGQRPVAVFDIDGVLADVRHRLQFVRSEPKDWEAFFAAAPEDPPLRTGFEMLTECAERCDVVVLTGRPELCRRETLTWLGRHGLSGVDLRMRRRGDHRPAARTKADLMRDLAATRTIEVVVDDDPLVVAEYRKLGLSVIHATWMDRPAELVEAQERDGRT